MRKISATIAKLVFFYVHIPNEGPFAIAENRPPRFARQRPEGGRDEFEKPNQPDG